MKKFSYINKGICCLFIILYFICTTTSADCSAGINSFPVHIEKYSESTSIKHMTDDEYNFLKFAIIWGKFEILDEKHFLRGLDVYNPYPYNQTMYVIGYVGYDGVGFIYRNASGVYCPWWLGFVSQHRLFVIGWGHSVQVW